MRKFAAILILIAGFAVGAIAQSAGLWTGTAINNPIAATVTNATCNAPVSGVTNICYTGTGAQISCNGAAYIPGSSCTAVSLTINGTAKNLPASFSISATAANVTAQ